MRCCFIFQVKKASAETEPAWKGAGQAVGTQIWRIVKFKVRGEEGMLNGCVVGRSVQRTTRVGVLCARPSSSSNLIAVIVNVPNSLILRARKSSTAPVHVHVCARTLQSHVDAVHALIFLF